jgi:hypothetical protein
VVFSISLMAARIGLGEVLDQAQQVGARAG